MLKEEYSTQAYAEVVLVFVASRQSPVVTCGSRDAPNGDLEAASILLSLCEWSSTAIAMTIFTEKAASTLGKFIRLAIATLATLSVVVGVNWPADAKRPSRCGDEVSSPCTTPIQTYFYNFHQPYVGEESLTFSSALHATDFYKGFKATAYGTAPSINAGFTQSGQTVTLTNESLVWYNIGSYTKHRNNLYDVKFGPDPSANNNLTGPGLARPNVTFPVTIPVEPDDSATTYVKSDFMYLYRLMSEGPQLAVFLAGFENALAPFNADVQSVKATNFHAAIQTALGCFHFELDKLLLNWNGDPNTSNAAFQALLIAIPSTNGQDEYVENSVSKTASCFEGALQTFGQYQRGFSSSVARAFEYILSQPSPTGTPNVTSELEYYILQAFDRVPPTYPANNVAWAHLQARVYMYWHYSICTILTRFLTDVLNATTP